MIDVLPEERWHELTDIFAEEFGAVLPNSGKANILADTEDDGTIRSFLVCEHLLRIGQIHSEGSYPRGMVRWLLERIPPDTSVITIASEPRFGRLYERLGMRPVKGQIFRRDF